MQRLRYDGELVFALLIGGGFAFVQLVRLGRDLASLPLTRQLDYLAWTWLSYALLGLVVSLVVAGSRRLLRRNRAGGLWAPAVVLGVCLWLDLLRIESPFGVATSATLSTLVAVAVGYLVDRRSRRPGGPVNAWPWAVATLAAFVGVAAWISWGTAVRHGVRWEAVLLFLGVALIPAALATVSAGVPRRWRAATLLLALGLTGLAVSWRAPVWGSSFSGTDPTNVILITVDTLRADHVGCYGSDSVRTPRMDRLAQEGLLFETAISPMPITNPTHTSLLTGLEPGNHGVTDNRPLEIRPGVVTLPEALSGTGRRTAAFVSGFTLKKRVCRLDRRFEIYDDDFSPVPLLPEPYFRNSLSRILIREQDRSRGWSERIARRTVDATESWLSLNADVPFFLWVHFYDPHGGYDPPAPYDLMYDPDYRGQSRGNWYALSPERRKALLEEPQEVAHLKARYAGEVTYTDEQIGRLIDGLARLDLIDRTLIVLTADHGESLDEHGHFFGHKGCHYDTALRVPLILRFPDGRGAGRRIASQVGLRDVAPTVLDHLDLTVPGDLDGGSLLGYLSGDGVATRRPPVISASFRGTSPDTRDVISVRSDTHKYIRTSTWWTGNRLLPEREELYDLAGDRTETVNLVDERPELAEHFRSVARPYRDRWFSRASVGGPSITEDDAERLRSLGYVQ